MLRRSMGRMTFRLARARLTLRRADGWFSTKLVAFDDCDAADRGFRSRRSWGYNPTGSGDSRNPVRPNVTPNFQWPALYEGVDCGSRGAVLQSGGFLGTGIRGRSEMLRAIHWTGPGYVGLGPLAVEGHEADRAGRGCSFARGVLQPPEPYETCRRRMRWFTARGRRRGRQRIRRQPRCLARRPGWLHRRLRRGRFSWG